MRYRSLLVVLIAGSLYGADSTAADAAQRRDLAAVRSAVSQRTNVNAAQPDGTTALHWAAHWNDLEMVTVLLRAGADPKAGNRFMATPLSEAAQAGDARIVEALL